MRFSSCLVALFLVVGCGHRDPEVQKEIDGLRVQVAALRADSAHRDAAETRKIDAAVLAEEDRAAEKKRADAPNQANLAAVKRADDAVAAEAARQAEAARRLVEDRALLARLKPMREECVEKATTHSGVIETCDKWLDDAAKTPGAADPAADARNRTLKANSQSELSQAKSKLLVIDLAMRQLSRRVGDPVPPPANPPMGEIETRSLITHFETQKTALVSEMENAPEGTDVRASTEWRTVLDLAIAEVGQPKR
jgi:hypothetical protein